MDGHPRQNPAYRPATKSPGNGAFSCGGRPFREAFGGVGSCDAAQSPGAAAMTDSTWAQVVSLEVLVATTAVLLASRRPIAVATADVTYTDAGSVQQTIAAGRTIPWADRGNTDVAGRFAVKKVSLFRML